MKIFAHRGASGYAPENTLTAIKKAIEMKADGIEIDIQLTKDGKIVVIHDWKVDRTTTGRGFVYELDFDYIRSLDAGQWYTKDFVGEVVPTLEEVLDVLPNDMMLNIEIKDTARKHSNIEEKMLEVLKKYPEKFDNIIVSSFHHDKIKRLQELEPKLKLALLTDSEFIEIDIQLTKDGKIVVIHDWKVDRTTTGRGFVYELDFDYIRSLDAGQWYTKDFIGEIVPTLEEVLDVLPNDMMLNIEIKDTARKHSNIEEKMLEVLKKYPEKFDNIVVSSFHHDKIRRLQELEPKLKLALLTDSEFIEIEKYLSTNGLNSYSYHPEINLISKKDVEILHENGVKVYVWTVNKEEDLDYLVTLGVDGVITNYPDIMKELLM